MRTPDQVGQGGPHAPEIPIPTPAVNHRFVEGIFLGFHHPQKQKTQIKQKKGFKVLVLYYHASSKGRPSLEGAHGGGAEKKPGSAGDSGSPSGQRAVVRKGTGWFLC